jgi:8-oxo-dGTP pyrophosphatase MutT (NUDIX family)
MPHIHEKIDFTVSVFVIHKNKILIRKHDKYGTWIGVGGHTELDEDSNQTAIREVKEEVGLDVVLWGEKPNSGHPGKTIHLIPPRFMNRHHINEDHEHLDLVYFASSNTDKVVPEKPNDEWTWLTLEELNNSKYNLSETIKLYAETALREVRS